MKLVKPLLSDFVVDMILCWFELIHFVVAEMLVVVIFPCLFKPFLSVDAPCFGGFVAAVTPVKRKEFKDGLFLFVCFSLLIFKLVVSFHSRRYLNFVARRPFYRILDFNI